MKKRIQISRPDTVMPIETLRDWFTWGLAIVVFISRMLVTASKPYWADGPAHIRAILSGRYLIQPPGYWLFNRIAGLFPNPQMGIEAMNWSFSAAGCVALYAVARLFVDKTTARLAAVAYASIYFTWFAGGVHSTYPAEMLFPPLLFLCLVSHYRTGDRIWLWGSALSFALAGGFRPSDGVFLGIMFVSYLFLEVQLREVAVVFMVTTLFCLVWLIPTWFGFREGYALAYTTDVTSIVSPLINGLNYRSLANMVRFLLPFATAFWVLMPFLAQTWWHLREREVQLLWLWILPGSLFLILIYMSNSEYMTFLTGAVILLSVIALNRSQIRVARTVLSIFIVWNMGLFLLFAPFQSKSFGAKLLNAYVGEDTLYGLQHRWFKSLF